MAISSTTNRVSYSGNGSTTVFSYPYYFLANADLVVIDRVTATGVETIKTLTTHYTVSGAGNENGGSVTMLAAPASGHTLTIYRDPAVTQDLSLVENDTLPATEVMKALDRGVMISQRHADELGRAVTLSEGYTASFDPTLPALITGGTVLAFNDDGDGFEVGPTVTEISTAQTSATAAAASATSAASSASAASTSATAADASATAAAASAAEITDVVFNVLSYGAVADGTTDNYAAFQALATAVNDLGGGTVLFPPGVYKIDGYRTLGNGKESPLYFNAVSGLRIIGYGAKIDINGNFNRTLNTDEAFSGIVISSCTNVEICGFEIDGNNDQMTKAVGVLEGTGRGHGIDIFSTRGISIRDCYLHHHQADGLYFGSDGVLTSPYISCREAVVENVRCEYNGRQGMSVVQLRKGTFINCSFSYTSRSSYGGHSPGAGVDVEPDRTTATASPNNIDINTGELLFVGCRFTDNSGAQFIAAYAERMDGITLESCYIDVSTGGSAGGSSGLILDVPRGVLRNSYVDVKQDIFYAGFAQTSYSSLWIEGNIIYGGGSAGTGQAFRSLYNIPVFAARNRFIGNHGTSSSAQFIQIGNSKCRFQDNYIFLPLAAYADDGAGDRHLVMSQNGLFVARNYYETDLLAASGSSGTAHFASNYGTDTIVVGEKYTGQAVGTADTIRPGINSSWDTAILFSNNGEDALASGSLFIGNSSNKAQAQAVTGDVTISNAGVTAIASGVIVNADVNASAAIAYSKLNLSGSVLNADVNASAAIAGTKISPDFGSQNLVTTGKGTFNSVQVGSAANTISALSTIVNTGTLTLPTSTDTLVGKATTDVFTNKSISGSTNTLSNIGDSSLSTSYIKADGTRALTANWSAGAFSATHNSVAVGSSANTITALRTIASDTTMTFQTNGTTTAGSISTGQVWTVGASGATVTHALNGALSANYVNTSDPTGNNWFTFQPDIAYVSAANSNTNYALFGNAKINAANSQNWTTTTGDAYVGVAGELQLASNAATGTVTSASAIQARLRLSGTGMTFTRAFGLHIRSPLTGSTITSQIQAGIAAASGGTNNITLWMGFPSGGGAPSGTYNIYQSDSTENFFNGDVSLNTAGNGIKIKEGTNARMGTAVLVAGSKVVSTTAVTASSRIQLTSNTDGGTPGWLRVSARTAGTSFTITSSSGTDTSTVAWVIFEPS